MTRIEEMSVRLGIGRLAINNVGLNVLRSSTRQDAVCRFLVFRGQRNFKSWCVIVDEKCRLEKLRSALASQRAASVRNHVLVPNFASVINGLDKF